MAVITNQIGTYRLYQYTKTTWSAVIFLKFKSGNYAYIRFLKSEDNLPNGAEQGGNFFTYFPYSQYADIVDMIRNEKPVYFRYDPSERLGSVSTSLEPIGEGET